MANAPRKHARQRPPISEEYVEAEQPAKAKPAPTSAPAGPTQAERIAAMKVVHEGAKHMEGIIRNVGHSRELAIAIQRLQESVLWANKHIATVR